MNKVLLFEYTTNCPVHDFIFSLHKQEIIKVRKKISLIEEYGTRLGNKHIEKVTNNIYELKIQGDKRQIRLLLTREKSTFLILHGFIKKQWKIPAKELKTAKRRLSTLTST